MWKPAACIMIILSLSKPCITHAQRNPFVLESTPASAEFGYKECSFDKEAEAVYLVNDAIAEYGPDYELFTYHHVKLKILKEKGKAYGTVTIPFYRDNNFEDIIDINGYVYNYGEGLTFNQVDKKSIFKQKVNTYWGEVRFVFPDVKVGSIIEYVYTSVQKNYAGLKEWEFQQEIPVLHSKFDLTILPGAEFAYSVQKYPELKIDIVPDNEKGKISYKMENIPGLRNESYMDSRNDYVQKVNFQLAKYSNIRYMTNWAEVNREMMGNNDFYGQLKKDLPGTGDFIKDVIKDSSPVNRLKLIYDFVKKNISWNGINSRSSPNGIKDAWSKKSGSNADVNLVLANLLRAAELDAFPMLVSERPNGKVHPELTFIDQFNTVCVCVTIDGRRYYLDATEKYTPYNLTPYLLLNTTAFIVNKKNGELVYLRDTSSGFKENIFINVSINKDGIAEGTYEKASFDYAREKQLKVLKETGISSIEKNYTAAFSGLQLNDMETINDEMEKESEPVKIKAGFTYTPNRSEGYSFIPLNLMSDFTDNPFTGENRFSNINFGYTQNIFITFQMTIDDAYAIDAAPKSTRITNEDKDISFTRQVFADKEKNQLLIRISLDIKNPLFAAGQYYMIKDFYKKMYDLLNEQVVLKKK